jgi:hypothetical protein
MALGKLCFIMDQYGWKNFPTILGENLPNRISTKSVEDFMGYVKSPFMALCKSGFIIYQWRKTEINDHGNPLRWPRDTLYPKKLAVTSPTSGGRSVDIVRSRTKATEFSFSGASFLHRFSIISMKWGHRKKCIYSLILVLYSEGSRLES